MKIKQKKDRTRVLWYIIAIGCLILFSLILLSSLLDIGERLRAVSAYLEISFYILIVILILLVIVRPIWIILKSPSLSIVTVLDKDSKEAYRVYRAVAKNISKSETLPEDSRLLLTNYKSPEELIFNIGYVFENNIKKEINQIIRTNARIVMISTALSQNARFDMFTVFGVNINMIKALVVKCGFRPSMKNLSKLTANVFSSALIADGLENLPLEDLMPKGNVLNEIPILGKLVGSAADGAANALLTIRIGCITRRYLFSDGDVLIGKAEIKREAFKESIKILPQVVGDVVTLFPKKIVNFFTKNKKEGDTVDGK